MRILIAIIFIFFFCEPALLQSHNELLKSLELIDKQKVLIESLKTELAVKDRDIEELEAINDTLKKQITLNEEKLSEKELSIYVLLEEVKSIVMSQNREIAEQRKKIKELQYLNRLCNSVGE